MSLKLFPLFQLRHLILAVLLMAGGVMAAASNDSQWITLGQSRYTLFFLHIYDVTLEAKQQSFHFPDTTPYALTFDWKRDVDAEDIINIIEQQWRAQHISWTPEWMAQLKQVIPDVQKGDKLRLEVNTDHTATALHNGKVLATASNPELVKAFAGIWLGDKSTYTRIHRQLLEHSK